MIKELQEKVQALEDDMKQLENNTIPNADGFFKMIIKVLNIQKKNKQEKQF